MLRRVPRVPAPLAILLAVVALFVAIWALIIPAWGGPDEDVHFAYVQTLVERHQIPGEGPNPVSSEQRLSMDFTNTDAVTFFNYAKPEWSETIDSQWQAQQRNATRNDGGQGNAASRNPPSYYMLETIPYRVARSGTIFSRLYAMRLFGGLWLLVSTIGAWLLAGEVFRRNRRLQLVTAAAMGLWPMTVFISSQTNPDGMLIALWTLLLWLGTAILMRGFSLGRAAGLFLCMGLLLVTKATALAFIPAFAFVVAVGAWRLRRHVSLRGVVGAGIAVALLLIPVVTWTVVANHTGHQAYGQATEVSGAGTSTPAPSGGGSAGSAEKGTAPKQGPAGPVINGVPVREFASYVWQYYLPRLPFMNPIRFLIPVFSHQPAFQTLFAGSWAVFGWVNVWFHRPVYLVMLGLAALIALLALVPLARRLWTRLRAGRRWPGRPGRRAAVATFWALTAGTLLFGLHWTDFHQYLNHYAPFIQGRYILPLGALFALVVAQATRAVPVRFQGAAAGIALAGVFTLQIACLGLVAARYYA